MDKTVKSESKAAQIIKALMAAYVITGVLLLLLAFVLYKFELDEGKVTLGIIGVYIVSCLVGGLIVGKRIGTRRFIWGLIVGAVYFLILTGVSMAVNRSLDGNVGSFLSTMVMCMGGGMLGGMLS